MYSAALAAIFRHRNSWHCSYASRRALPTKDVHTRLGAPVGTTIVRVCQGKLYPQHQYGTPCDRRAISRSIIGSTRSPVLATPILESLRNAERNSAIALGFCAFGTSNSRRRFIGLRLKVCVSTSRGIFELRNGRAAKSRLFTAS